MAEKPKDKNQTYQLKDVDVFTVGLVSRGANGKQFFLTKSENVNTEDNSMTEQDNVQTTPAVELTDEIKDFAREEATKASEGAVRSFFKKLFGEGEGASEEEPTTEPKATVEVIPEEVQKRLDAVDALQKSHQELMAKLEKAEEELLKANSNAVKQSFLAKAEKYRSIGADQEEVADFMAFLSKADNEKLEWFENFAKGVDSQLAEAGIYSEFGKLNTPEQDDDPIQSLIKSGEAKDEKEAYLKIGEDQEKAQKLLKQRRSEIRTG